MSRQWIAWLIPLQAQQRLRKWLARCFKLVRSLISTAFASRASTYTRMVSFKDWGLLRSHTSEEAPKEKQTTNAKVAWQSLSEPMLLWLWMHKVWDMGSSNTIGRHICTYQNILSNIFPDTAGVCTLSSTSSQILNFYLLAVLQNISDTRVHKCSYHIIYKKRKKNKTCQYPWGPSNGYLSQRCDFCILAMVSWAAPSVDILNAAPASWGVVRQPTIASSQMAASKRLP